MSGPQGELPELSDVGAEGLHDGLRRGYDVSHLAKRTGPVRPAAEDDFRPQAPIHLHLAMYRDEDGVGMMAARECCLDVDVAWDGDPKVLHRITGWEPDDMRW